MELLINIFLIAVIAVFIIDLSGAINNLVKPIVRKILHLPPNADIHLPLIGCSLCVTFWAGLIYLLAVKAFALPGIVIVCIVSFLTPIISDTLILCKDLLTKLIDLIYLMLQI